MQFKDQQELEQYGFTGFVTIDNLWNNPSILPKKKGVYLVLNDNVQKTSYLEIGTGGFFKGKDPNVLLSALKSNWVDNTIVLYIGKAGSEEGQATLHSRLGQYLKFGQGKNIGHWGGRLIWQLKDAKDLIICWKTLSNEDPREVEKNLIREFVQIYTKRPFANLAD